MQFVAAFTLRRAEPRRLRGGGGERLANEANEVLQIERLLQGRTRAETEDLIANAKSKLESKNLDLIVANDVTAPGAGFGGETNAVVLLRRDGTRTDVPLSSKREVAERILDEVIALRSSARVHASA